MAFSGKIWAIFTAIIKAEKLQNTETIFTTTELWNNLYGLQMFFMLLEWICNAKLSQIATVFSFKIHDFQRFGDIC